MLFLCSPPAGAQTRAADNAGADSSQLQEVTVTAQRRTENLQDVPIAITNLTAAEVEAQQINGTADIPRLVPNMFTNNNTGTGSGNVYFLRGLGQTESFATFDPQVGQYVDDIYIGRGSGANFELFDVDQIQVLRGPQGTLFGRNATGGAIVISLTKPGQQAGGYLDLSYGAYDRVTLKGAVDLPINDELFTRTAVSIVKDRGYVDDVATGTHQNFHDDHGIRESILFKPSERVTWNATIDASESMFNAEQNSPYGGVRVNYSGFGDPNAPVPVIGGAGVVTDLDGILRESFSNLPNGEDIKTWGAMSNLEVKLDAGTLNFITGLRAQKQLGNADFPFPAVSGALVPYDDNELGQFGITLDGVDRQLSQEIKFSGTTLGDRLNYTAGLFYLYEWNRTVFVETLTVPVGPVAAPSVFGFELSAPENFHNDTKSAAAYLQGDYKFTDALTLTLGVRFTDEQKGYEVFAEPSAAGAAGYDTADVQADGHATDLKTNQVTPRVVVQYKLDPEVMAFASATKGFQGGGWNSLTNSPELVTAFTPETVWTYETGVRTEWFDKKLVANADIFYNDVHDYQLITLGPGGGANFVTENAANMSVYGFEADFAFRPIENLTITGNVGLEDGGYYDLSPVTLSQLEGCRGGNASLCNGGIVSPVGTIAPPENFPHSTFSLNGNYVWKQDRFDLTPMVAVQFTSKVHTDTQDAPQGVSAAHTLLDASLKFHAKDAPWYLVAECQNCMMKNYVVSNLFVQYWNTPGIWDVKVRYDF
jgi:iron complex outermembrane receptor protein